MSNGKSEIKVIVKTTPNGSTHTVIIEDGKIKKGVITPK